MLNAKFRHLAWLSLTLPTAAENLALDEALLESAFPAGGVSTAENSAGRGEVLRVWEPAESFVVLGRSSRHDDEVNRIGCRELSVPVLRRASGGATILTGPGCLMYSLILSRVARPALHSIAATHEIVLGALAAALGQQAPGVERAGTSDLAIAGRKFSGNSLRCLHDRVLYHGTLLYDFPLERIGRCLRMPPRQPDYRAGRDHVAFVMNLPLGRESIVSTLRAAFGADEPCDTWPMERTRQLAVEKYAAAAWTRIR